MHVAALIVLAALLLPPPPTEPPGPRDEQAGARGAFARELNNTILKIPRPPDNKKGALLLSYVPPVWKESQEAVEGFGGGFSTWCEQALQGITGQRYRWVDKSDEERSRKRGEAPWDVRIWFMVAPASDTAGATRCTMFVRLEERGKTGKVPIHEFLFDPRIFGRATCTPPTETFLSDNRIGGLQDGARSGKDGLAVTLDLIGQETPSVLCEGTEFRLVVDVTRGPAWVRIYSLAEDGTVMLDWASKSPIKDRWFTDPAIPIRLPPNARYRILAVAVPESLDRNGFGTVKPPPNCLGGPGTGFSVRLLPPEAAVATLTYRVVPPGAAPCPPDAEAEKKAAKIKEALKKIPTCGE